MGAFSTCDRALDALVARQQVLESAYHHGLRAEVESLLELYASLRERCTERDRTLFLNLANSGRLYGLMRPQVDGFERDATTDIHATLKAADLYEQALPLAKGSDDNISVVLVAGWASEEAC